MIPFFVFSGQGAQFAGMGKDIADKSASAKAIFDKADEVLGYKLSDIIFNGPDELLTQTIHCQPAIYTVSCAALTAFREKYPQTAPLACAGLSLGEYGALYAAGAFDFSSGLKLLAKRAQLMDNACKSTNGSMASVLNGDPQIIKEVCARHQVDVANFNSPGQIVISGDKELLAQAVNDLKAEGIRKVIVLNVAGAFHSRLMKQAGDALGKVLAESEIKQPTVPVYHNFTASPARDAAQLRLNLASQVAGSVRWEESVRAMAALGADTMIEFGPGNVLTKLCSRTLPELKTFNINSVETLDNFTAGE
ncbi:MAG: ACP S-malonyltransferase [Lentisphaerae bacterium]|nr:ACP S-malonyltransferase [Lentisphaerota bacterium]